MNEMDYKPNSHAYKARQQKEASEKKRVEKVVTGPVKIKKKNELSKLTDIIFAEDARSVGAYIITDVVIPSVINLLEDIFLKGSRFALRGESGRGRTRDSEYISYRSYSDPRNSTRDRTPKVNQRYSFDKVIISNRGEAEEVLSQMDDLVDTYGFATIADLNEALGITGEYTDNKYGWIGKGCLRNAEVVRTREGYVLKMPRATVID